MASRAILIFIAVCANHIKKGIRIHSIIIDQEAGEIICLVAYICLCLLFEPFDL